MIEFDVISSKEHSNTNNKVLVMVGTWNDSEFDEIM
jgi:hypothetical protein